MKTSILLLALAMLIATAVYLDNDYLECEIYAPKPVRQLTTVKCNGVIYEKR